MDSTSLSSISSRYSDPKDAYTSEEFKASGYSWKLIIYPKGNKKKNVEDHLSVYLQIAGTNSLEIGWEVYVDFRLFLLDQNKNVYTVFEDAFTKSNCIHGAKLDVGFDKLVPLYEFHDVSYGYLVDDKCVFGAEVFVCKERRRGIGECVLRENRPITYKHIWKLRNFSSLTDLYYTSEPFTAGGQKWILQLYPKGENQQNTSIRFNLRLADQEVTPPATKVFVEYSIRIVNPWISNIHWSRTEPVKWCFTPDGLSYVHGIAEGPCDSIEESTSIKTKRVRVDPNKIKPYSKGSICLFFASLSVLVFVLNKNKTSLGHWFGSTKTNT